MVLYPQILRGRRVPWGTYNRSARVGQREGDSRLPCGFYEPGQGNRVSSPGTGWFEQFQWALEQRGSPRCLVPGSGVIRATG